MPALPYPQHNFAWGFYILVMARPKKNNADYFSHDSDMRNNNKVRALRNNFTNGYSIWCMLLEYLTGKDGNVFPYNDIEFELMAGDFGVSVTEIRDVINYCIRLGMLSKKEELIYSESLDERLKPVYDKRLAAKDNSDKQHRIDGRFCGNNTEQTVVSVTETPQSKVNEIKVNEIQNTNAADAAPRVPQTPKKPKPVVEGYEGCVAVYDTWLKSRTGVGVKMDGIQGKAMKEIIKYLDAQKLNKEQPVEEVWEFILNSWDRLTDYHKNKLKLSEINSDLINILNQIKNGRPKSKHTNEEAVAFALSLKRDI